LAAAAAGLAGSTFCSKLAAPSFTAVAAEAIWEVAPVAPAAGADLSVVAAGPAAAADLPEMVTPLAVPGKLAPRRAVMWLYQRWALGEVLEGALLRAEYTARSSRDAWYPLM